MNLLKHASTLVLVSAVAASAFGQMNHELQKGIDSQYRKMEAGLLKQNSAQVLALCSPNYMWITETGDKIDRAGFKKMLAPDKNMKFRSVRMINDSYDFDGNIARVRNQGHVVMDMREGKKWSRYQVTTECVDTWKKGRNGWLLVKTEVTSTAFSPM